MTDEQVRGSTADAARRLEDAWKSGGNTDLGQFLPLTGDPERIVLLVRLVKIDQHYSWRAGQGNLLEEYLRRWPELQGHADAISDLLRSECEIRAAMGNQPSEQELQQRFPTLCEHVDLNTIAVDSKGAESSPRGDEGQPDESRQPGQIGPNFDTTPVSRDATPTPHPSWRLSTSDGRVGRYEVRALIGAGGMGEVYRAFDTELQREVALKIPRVYTDTKPELLNRFVQEALAAASLRHPNICPVYDAGRMDDRYYIVMALIEGTNLADDLRQGVCDPAFAVRVVTQVARALQSAHEVGIVHRDIKPANILMDKSRQPLLTDFGLARRVDTDEQLSAAGSLLGTPAYMSPEQAEMQPVDHRTDVYSLGVVLYQMLTGQLPYPGPPAQLLLQIVKGKPPKPSKLRPELDAALETICLKAMARDARHRYQTAADFAEALEDHAKPSIPAVRDTRQRVIWSFVVALLLVGVAVALVRWGRNAREAAISGTGGAAKTKPLTEREKRLADLEGQLAQLSPALAEIDAVRQLGDSYLKVKESFMLPNAQAVGRDTATALAKLKTFGLTDKEAGIAEDLETFLAQDSIFRTPEDGYLLLREIAEMMDVRIVRLQPQLAELQSSEEVTGLTEPPERSWEDAIAQAADAATLEAASRIVDVQQQLDALKGVKAEIAALRDLETEWSEATADTFGQVMATRVAIECYVRIGRMYTFDLTESEMDKYHTAQNSAFRMSWMKGLESVYTPARAFAEHVNARVALLEVKLAGLKAWTPDATQYGPLIEMQPPAVQALCDEARIYTKHDSFPDVIAIVTKAIETSPDDAALYALRANFHVFNQDDESAMADINLALARSKQLGYAYYLRGTVHASRREFTLAVGDYDKALQLDPGSWEAYRGRADAYNQIGAFPRAMEDCDQALKMNPEDGHAYRARAVAWIGQQQWDKALGDAREAVRLNPIGAYGYFVLARVLHHQEDYQQACDNLSRAVLLISHDSEFYRLRAACYEKLGNQLRARADRIRADNMDAASNKVLPTAPAAVPDDTPSESVDRPSREQ